MKTVPANDDTLRCLGEHSSDPSPAENDKTNLYDSDDGKEYLRAGNTELEPGNGGCLVVSGSGSALLADVKISGGRSIRGSGMAAINSKIFLSRVELSHNGISVESDDVLLGGGGYFLNSTISASFLSVKSNTLILTDGDAVAHGAGIAMYFCPGAFFSDSLFVQNVISANQIRLRDLSGYSYVGAGLYSVSAATVVIDRSNFIGNSIWSNTTERALGYLHFRFRVL